MTKTTRKVCAILDDPTEPRRGDTTCIFLPIHTTISDAIQLINEKQARSVWGVLVDFHGITPKEERFRRDGQLAKSALHVKLCDVMDSEDYLVVNPRVIESVERGVVGRGGDAVISHELATESVSKKRKRSAQKTSKSEEDIGCKWSIEEDTELLKGLDKYGRKWCAITREFSLQRTSSALRARFQTKEFGMFALKAGKPITHFHEGGENKQGSKGGLVSVKEEQQESKGGLMSIKNVSDEESSDLESSDEDDENYYGRNTRPQYAIGERYFLLHTDGIEYPVKVIKPGKKQKVQPDQRLIKYQGYGKTKRVSIKDLLRPTEKRELVFRRGVAKRDSHAKSNRRKRSSQEDDEKRTAREEERQRKKKLQMVEKRRQTLIKKGEQQKLWGKPISTELLPPCTIPGKLIKQSYRWVYFARDDEMPIQISRRFGISVERLIYDNKDMYPNVRERSRFCECSAIVLPKTCEMKEDPSDESDSSSGDEDEGEVEGEVEDEGEGEVEDEKVVVI